MNAAEKARDAVKELESRIADLESEVRGLEDGINDKLERIDELEAERLDVDSHERSILVDLAEYARDAAACPLHRRAIDKLVAYLNGAP